MLFFFLLETLEQFLLFYNQKGHELINSSTFSIILTSFRK